jgi:hypothetical protein
MHGVCRTLIVAGLQLLQWPLAAVTVPLQEMIRNRYGSAEFAENGVDEQAKVQRSGFDAAANWSSSLVEMSRMQCPTA